jgi:hypothetical protein
MPSFVASLGDTMIDSVERRLARVTVSVVLGVLAALSLITGIGCVTAAVWIALAREFGPIVSASVIGLAYFALAAVLFALMKARAPVGAPLSAPEQAPLHGAAPPSRLPPSGLPPMAQAFLYGIEAAMNQPPRRR